MKKLIKNLLFLSVATTSIANASYTVNAKVDIGMPEIETQIKEALVAFVNEGAVSFVAKEDSICGITDNFGQSGVKNGKLNCYVEISQIPAGMVQKDLSIVGIPQIHGKPIIKTDIYYRSGSGNEKVLIKSENWAVDIENPTEPKVLKISTIWNVGEKTASELITHNRANYVKDFYMEVEPRPYKQRFKVDTIGECIIPKNGTSCKVNENFSFPESLGLSGEIIKNIHISSENNYFNKQEGEYKFIYDFTPPQLGEFGYKALYEKNKYFNEPVYILDYQAQNNEAILIIKSPYIGKVEPNDVDPVENWFLPENSKMILKMTPSDKEGGLREDLKDYNIASEFVQLNSERAVYKFDLSKLPDGYFIPEINARDRHNNISTPLKPNLMKLDRTPPIIYVKRNDKNFEGGAIYSFSELTFTATDGIDIKPVVEKGFFTENKSIEMIPYAKDPEWVRAKEPELKYIAPNTTDRLKVYAYDSNGNEGVWDQEVNFLPTIFSINTEVLGDVYQKISEISMPINQDNGAKCDFYLREADSMTFAQRGNFTCMAEKIEVPSGIAERMYLKTYKLEGFPQEMGQQRIALDVFTYSKYGDKIYAGTIDETLDVKLPPPPKIDFISNELLVENKYIQTSTIGDLIGKIYVTSLKETKVSVDYEEEQLKDIDFFINKRINGGEKTVSAALGIEYGLEKPGEVWAKKSITLKANYVDFPEVKSEKTIETVNVPPFERMKLIVEGKDRDNTIFDIDTYKLKLKFGILTGGQGQILFDEKFAGKWKLYIAEYDAEKNLVPITEKVDATQEGYEFNLSGFTAGERNFIPVAELVSPYPEISRTVLGSKIFTTILNTKEIDGGLYQSTKYGVAPMYTRTKLYIDETQHQKSLGLIEWEESYDLGQTWTKVDYEKSLVNHIKILDKKGFYSVRAKLYNKYNESATSYTETVTYQAVEQPEIIVNGPNSAFDNDVVTIKPELADPTIPLNVIYQYSMDKGKNWVNLDTESISLTGKIGDFKEIIFKARYEESPVDSEDSYSYTKHQVSFVKYKAPRVSIFSNENKMEVGRESTVIATVTEPYPNLRKEIKFEFELPNGQIITDKELKFTPTQEMIDGSGYLTIKYRAWIDGYKETTFTENRARFKAINYIWPNFTYSTNVTYEVVPSYQQITIMPYGIDIAYLEGLKYEWILPSGVEEYRDGYASEGFTGKIIVKEAGEKTIIVNISDSRGNKQQLNIPVNAVEAEPVVISINPKIILERNVEPYLNYFVATYTGGHKNDKVEYIKWYLNDSLLEGKNSFQLLLSELPHGDYKIKSEFGMKLSQPVFGEYNLKVEKNIKPTCSPVEIIITPGKYGKQIAQSTANCQDPDSIIYYNWKNSLNGVSYSKKKELLLTFKNVSEISGLVLEVTTNHNQKLEITPTIKY